MNTLIIHPKDRSTDFLKPIYAGIDNATVVTGGVRKDTLRQMVEDYDRVIMLGHGSPSGLMSVGQFKGSYRFADIVDDSFAGALAQKDNSIYIWCNADKFVNYHKLHGFYTGMFISEIYETYFMKVRATQEQIAESNDTFAKVVGAIADLHPVEMLRLVRKYYGKLGEHNPVVAYNNARLYVSQRERVAA